MARALTPASLAAAEAVVVRPVLFYEGWFAATGSPQLQALRLWTGIGPFTWNGVVWTGAGEVLGISPIDEASTVRANGVTVSLTLQSDDIKDLALEQARQGLPGRIWIGFMDSANALIVDPFLAFEGRFDKCEVLFGGEASVLSGSYESRLIDLDRARDRRYTHADQQLEHEGDRGFEYMQSLQDAAIEMGGRFIPNVTYPGPDPNIGGGGAGAGDGA